MQASPDDIFNLCIQLSANDRISSKNAWQLPLIDCIDQVLDFVNCDFVRSAGAIQASAKIYSNRVDVLARQVENLQQGTGTPSNRAEQSEPEQELRGSTVKRVQKAKFRRADPEDLLIKPQANAYFDSNFHQMFTVGQTQMVGQTELFMPLTTVYDFEVGEITGMQQLLTKSQRFLEVSQVPVYPVCDLQYDACEADVTSASYVSLLASYNDSLVEEEFAFSAFPGKYMAKDGKPKAPRAARPPRPAKVASLSECKEIRFLPSIAKTQSKFVFTNQQPPEQEFYFLQHNQVFEADNVNKFLLSNYRQTQMSRMPSITELSVHEPQVQFADNLTADEVDREMSDILNDVASYNPTQPNPLSQSMQNSTFKYLEDYNLIQQKLTIGLNVITTKFARKPKKIDIAELKNSLYKEIRVLKAVDFGGLVQNYQPYHSRKVGALEDVSTGMLFVGLLHLASEQGVKLAAGADGRILVSEAQK